VIGPRRAIEDHTGDWAQAREIRDAGCLIVRPDHHVAWRSETAAADPAGELRRVFNSLLAR
jgi:2,4-dichlorophenol 6-monooxygenase